MPPETTAFSLLDALSESGFQSSVIATYCCYFPFYEDVVLRRLLDRGCTNNILLVDANRCADAFASEDTRPRRAGRDYTLIPVHLRGAFHPKLIVALGKLKGALFVGSHNMTLAGFGLNDEITNAFRTRGAGARRETEVIREALVYLQSFAPAGPTDIGHAFTAARRTIPWLNGPTSVDSTERALITSTGQDIGLWEHIRPLIPKRLSTALVCGPFFDKKLTFLQRLLDEAKPDRLVVGIDPESVEIDSVAVRNFRGAEFVNVSGLAPTPNRRESSSTYLHAKLLWFKGPDGELLVTGSANPSAPAFLSGGAWRNAEAVVADSRRGAAKVLGLDSFLAAPRLEANDWMRMAARQADQLRYSARAAGTVVLAVPADGGLLLERPIGPRIPLEAFSADGSLLGHGLTGADSQVLMNASAVIRDGAQTLRGIGQDNTPIVVLVHRTDEVARHAGGVRQHELRQALGALDEDPAQLETLLKLVEKVIFDSDALVASESAVPAGGEAIRADSSDIAPESLAIEAVGRSARRKRKSLASGDILVLLDALMTRLGEGLAETVSSRAPSEEVRPITDDYAEEEESPSHFPNVLLADACRRKVGRLVRRMIRQLGTIHAGGVRRVVVQLAAVLSMIHSLRNIEQRMEWRSHRLTLVNRDHEWQLFEAGAFAFGWGASSLGPTALAEGGGEAFQELSISVGLLAWLAWEVDIDVRSSVERTGSLDPDEDSPWYPIQAFAAIAGQLAADWEAAETLTRAVGRTPRKGFEGAGWIATHLGLATRIWDILRAPEAVYMPSRAPRPGDLVILGSTLDPRVRIALEVEPSDRSSDKITVFDLESEDLERKVLASHVKYVGWLESEVVPRMVTGA